MSKLTKNKIATKPATNKLKKDTIKQNDDDFPFELFKKADLFEHIKKQNINNDDIIIFHCNMARYFYVSKNDDNELEAVFQLAKSGKYMICELGYNNINLSLDLEIHDNNEETIDKFTMNVCNYIIEKANNILNIKYDENDLFISVCKPSV